MRADFLSTTKSTQQHQTQSYATLNEWLGARDIARYLSIPYSTAFKLIKRLPHRKFGKHLRIPKHLLHADPAHCDGLDEEVKA